MERKTKETRIFLRISEEEKAAWQQEADARGLTLSKLIRHLVNEAIARTEKH